MCTAAIDAPLRYLGRGVWVASGLGLDRAHMYVFGVSLLLTSVWRDCMYASSSCTMHTVHPKLGDVDDGRRDGVQHARATLVVFLSHLLHL